MPDPGIAGTGAAEGATGRRAAMPFILFTVLLDMVAIGLMVPVLPHIVGRFTDSPDAQTLAFLAVTLAFGIANFFGSPVLGALSDRFGRRPVLLIGFLGMATSFFVTAAATALWMLVAVRLFSGAMQSNISVANAYVADISTADDRARRFGQLGAMFGIGFILGPAVGGVLGDIDVRLPFVVAGTLALANTGLRLVRAARIAAARAAAPVRVATRQSGVGAARAEVARRASDRWWWRSRWRSLAQYTLHMTWVLYTKFKFGWGPGQVGWSLFVVGLVAAVGAGGADAAIARALVAAAAGRDRHGLGARWPSSPGAWRPSPGWSMWSSSPTCWEARPPRPCRASSPMPPTRPRKAARWGRCPRSTA
jgi:DHA1 family tetracycline resistance protein-like MFS transporter